MPMALNDELGVPLMPIVTQPERLAGTLHGEPSGE